MSQFKQFSRAGISYHHLVDRVLLLTESYRTKGSYWKILSIPFLS